MQNSTTWKGKYKVVILLLVSETHILLYCILYLPTFIALLNYNIFIILVFIWNADEMKQHF